MTEQTEGRISLHPQVQAYLDRLAQFNFGELHTFPLELAREGVRRGVALLGEPEAVAVVQDRSVSLAEGDIRVRVYTPAGAGPFPVLVFFHGGGFVLGDLDTHDGLCRSLANGAESLVVSVDYPRAPEHKFPAAPDACYAATRWVAENAADLGGDPTRIAVGGDSAGGNLAAVVALMARDLGGPALVFQLLIYPDLDFRRTNYSIREFAGKYGNISRATQHWFMDNYLTTEAEKLDPRVSPLLAPDLSGLPPTLVITAEYDALRDEGEQYGRRLEEAGVPVTVSRYPGMIHEFVRHPFDDSARARSEAATALRKAFILY
ncbi:acetyl esterase [Nocardia amikacinitolerans]|uniref:Acetyl esterase n=1 Tax=Nocardia amikacinitolerans TaxID=756689 RepID=A0A285M1Y6_9NOCA|nr:alpha/beta hydrolase [Nocardia amikacinitolerans]SNY89551.1 acetyl esterase [Nocardia amikacinitolerans]